MHGQPFRQQRCTAGRARPNHFADPYGSPAPGVPPGSPPRGVPDRHSPGFASPRLNRQVGRLADPGPRRPTALVVMKMPSPLPPLHHLGVAGHPPERRTPQATVRMAATMCRSMAIARPSSRIRARLRAKGHCAHHRQVVDGADHRSAANVAARENQGPHHIRVGGEGQCPRPSSKRGSIVKDPSAGPKAGTNSSSISRWLRPPPPPWPS